ncbi:VOC family protein [Nonomuraea polychroma]|uniref:VOC family protein n=1 Tax=Nonomuraea polychroma TaxID=46176 RepID=UPI000FDD4B21|nr:VOC family protein [Nonomuraea polychroma]
MSLSDHVDHVGIAAHNADQAMPFYVERLGLTVIGDERAADPGVRLVYIDGGNVMLQLVEPYREGPVARFLRERGEGLHHVCFNVRGIGASLAALTEREPLQ